MPYTSKGNCVYKKDTGEKVGCTKGSVTKYLAALHANVNESSEDGIETKLRTKYGEYLNGLDIYENKGSLILSRIIIKPDSRDGGIGTKIMNDLVEYADANSKIIVLTPSNDFGGNKNRLIQFYKRFGFKHNKGVHKSFEFREAMIRYPKLNTMNNQTMAMENKILLKTLLREAIDLTLQKETPNSKIFDIYYNTRKAGSMTCAPANNSLGEDTIEISALNLDKQYTDLNVASQAIQALWSAYPNANKLIVVLPSTSNLFWEKLGFNRLNDTYHILFRGH